MNSLDLDGAHWRFALALYGQDGAADACLALQDRLGVDVNILLLAMFAVAERGMAVTSQDVRSMDGFVKAWRTETVTPLRKMRRRLKQPLEPAGEYAEVLRTKIKQAELLAEQIEQALLAQWLDRRTGERSSESPDLAAVLNTVVAYFAEGAGPTADMEAPDVQGALRSLLLAAGHMTPGAIKSSS
jgi:uncharacterized protein (TIGR02444 family)